MDTKQIAEFLNTTQQDILTNQVIVNQDLSNIVDLGKALYTENQNNNFLNNLVDRIATTIFDNKMYKSNDLGLIKSNYEYGGVLQKIYTKLPKATISNTWELQDNTEYNQDIYLKPVVITKYYNKQVVYNIPISSLTYKQLQNAFTTREHITQLFDMIVTSVLNSIEFNKEILEQATLNNLIGETLAKDIGGGLTFENKSTLKVVNLLYLYNQTHTEQVTKDNCLYNKDFIKYAVETIKKYKNRLTKYSKSFNVGELETFTDLESQRLILIDDFKASIDTTIIDSYNTENLKLDAKSVPYWQSGANNYAFTDTSKLNIKTASGVTIDLDGVIGVLFDNEACGVWKNDFRVKTHENSAAEFVNYWYKFEASYYNDLNKNAIVFIVN